MLLIFLKFFDHAFSTNFLDHLSSSSGRVNSSAEAKYHTEAATNKRQHEPNDVKTDNVEPIDNKQSYQSVVPLSHLKTLHFAALKFLRRNRHRGFDSKRGNQKKVDEAPSSLNCQSNPFAILEPDYNDQRERISRSEKHKVSPK